MMNSEIGFTVQKINESKLPISQEELTTALEDELNKIPEHKEGEPAEAAESDLPTNKTIIAGIIAKLQQKSSKFKYLVNVSRFTRNKQDLVDLENGFGALWDEENDGYLSSFVDIDFIDDESGEVDGGITFICSVYFVHV
ncbi:unnamed protein product [Ambrosiozyma monospora]|uniref:Unnamed protein product n=1 Tax=Ambrosiozyma monospora TaxID=43982 RepID=A0ACB5T8I0_AMBMO|nr:unnamed protein product [Ambrosiozyma monospora]